MTPERWQQIDQLFHAALECGPAQREEFLTAGCDGDEPLRREVESLLSSFEDAAGFIETPAGDVAAELLGTHHSTYEPDDQIQNYRILRDLGSGGMGEVYLAEDIRLKRKVALKLLPQHFTVNPDRVRRFEREARAASALNHPNIVTIYEIGQSNTTHFIATEFVDGKTLRQLINEKPFTLTETLNVSMQVAEALSGAHAAGIIHRDVKPENIMIRPDGYVKILDFGLAKLTEQQVIDADLETPTLLQTNPGLVMGTVQYMSPEQARAKNVGVGTDIWSLGIVIYELLAGHVPFSGETSSHVLVSLMENKLPPLRDHANVPEELDRFVSKALRKNQRERYQTSDQLASDLRGLKQKLQLDSDGNEWLKTVPSKKDGLRVPPPAPVTTVSGAHAAETSRLTDAGTARTTSNIKYLTGKAKHQRLSVMLAAAAVVILVSAFGYYFYFVRNVETIDSIAVLPFVNVNNDPNLEYLSDGLSDNIIDSLSKLPNLKTVISLSSVLRYKGKQTDPQAIGRELDVRAVLTGRLTQVGDELLIFTELVDVKDNRRLWSEQYKRKLADVLPLQSEIAQKITEKLRLRLTGEEKQRLAKTPTQNPEASQLYMLGLFHRRNRAGIRIAIDYLEQAIKKDPNYALAYAQLAYTYASASLDRGFPRKEARERVEWAVQRALELDDTLGDAHAALAIIEDDWSVQTKEFQRALELDPNSADVHAFYARILWAHRRIDEAIPQMKRAVELDPLSPVLQGDLGKILYSAGLRDQAMEQYRKALELNKNYVGAHHHLANLYLAEGRYEEAIAEAEKMSANLSNEGLGQPFLGYTYAVAGKRAEAEKILQDLKERSKQSHVDPEAFALIYTGLGDKDRAFEFLQKEFEENEHLPVFINILPEWDSLRTDPRFEELIRKSEWHRE